MNKINVIKEEQDILYWNDMTEEEKNGFMYTISHSTIG